MIPKTTLTIRSRAFTIWKAREATEKRRVTIDEIVAGTGLAKNTVRRMLEPEADVSGNTLSSVVIMAQFFGVSLSEMVEVAEEERGGTTEE